MGKGDKKTKKGKITQGSYGKTRPKKSSKSVIPAKVEKPKKEVATKAEKPKKTEKSTEEAVVLGKKRRSFKYFSIQL